MEKGIFPLGDELIPNLSFLSLPINDNDIIIVVRNSNLKKPLAVRWRDIKLAMSQLVTTGAISVSKDGSIVVNAATNLNFTGDGVSVSPNTNSATINIPGLSAPLQRRLIAGGAVWTGTGFIYDVSELIYTFGGPILYAAPVTLTFSPADPTDPRTDAIVVDVFGNVTIIEGTPAPAPIDPVIPPDQLVVQYVSIPAGATTPTVAQDDVYFENVEWVTSEVVSGVGTGTIDFNSANSPYAGFKCIQLANTNTAQQQWFTRGPSLDLTQYATFSLRIRIDSSLPANARISVMALLSGNPVSFIYNILTTVDPLDTGWQLVVIPVSAFAAATIDQIVILNSLETGSPAEYAAARYNYSLDNIMFQGGTPPIPGGGITIKTEDVLNALQTLINFKTGNAYLEITSNGAGDEIFTVVNIRNSEVIDVPQGSPPISPANQSEDIGVRLDMVVWDGLSPYPIQYNLKPDPMDGAQAWIQVGENFAAPSGPGSVPLTVKYGSTTVYSNTVDAGTTIVFRFEATGDFWRVELDSGSGGSGSITADSGITATTSTNVQLGSSVAGNNPLLHNTYIDLNAFILDFLATYNAVVNSSMLRIAPGLVNIGDNSSSSHNMTIDIDDPNYEIKFRGLSQVWLAGNVFTDIYTFGELTGTGSPFGTHIYIDSANGIFRVMSRYVGATIVRFLDLDGTTGLFQFGDIDADNNGTVILIDDPNQTYILNKLSGAGTRMVTVGATGILGSAAIPGGGSGTVTNVATGTGLTGGPITTTGTVELNSKLAPADSLTGNALKLLRVNAGETAVEYVTPVSNVITIATIVLNGLGGVIQTGAFNVYTQIPYACTITGWTITGNPSGSINLDIYKSTYAGFPPAGPSIFSPNPTLTAGVKNTASGLSIAVAAGDMISGLTNSATTITACTLVIFGTKS